MNMKVFAVAAMMACMLGGAVAELDDYETDEGVLVLTADTFDSALEEFNPLLVEFYAPWCGHCKRLAPEYAKAAQALAELDEPLYIAKVDATAESSLGSKYGVQGYPTLKFFRGGKPSDYEGGRTEKDIVNWVKKKSGPATTKIDSAEAATKFIDASDVVVIGFFDAADSDAAKAFTAVASTIDDVSFGLCTDASVAEENEAKLGSIVLFKDFDEGRNDFDGDLEDKDAISAFVSGNSLPLVIAFSQEAAPKIFGGAIKKHFLLFVDEEADYFDGLKEEFTAVASENKGTLLHVTVGLDNDRVMSYFGVTEDDLPSAVIVDMPENAALKKYLFDGEEVNKEGLIDFAARYLAGDVSPFLKSADVPESNDEPVKVVVGKSFKDIVLDEDKDVLLEFYAPWCGHCKALAPKYDELAEKLSGVENLVIAKMDATENEIDHPGVDVRGFPTIKFFPAGDKSSVVDFDGEREVDGFIKFLKQHAKSDIDVDGEDAEL